jgi:hypothetical protein
LTEPTEQGPAESKKASLPCETVINKIYTINKADENGVNTINTVNKENEADSNEILKVMSGTKKPIILSFDSGLHQYAKNNFQSVGCQNLSILAEEAIKEYFVNHQKKSDKQTTVNFNYIPKKPGELDSKKSLQLFLLKEDLANELPAIPCYYQRIKQQKGTIHQSYLDELRKRLRKATNNLQKFMEKNLIDDPQANAMLENADKILRETSSLKSGE